MLSCVIIYNKLLIKMKKFNLLAIASCVLFGLSGCGKRVFTVHTVTSRDVFSPKISAYEVDCNVWFNGFSFYDSTGKYNAGDTIKFTK